jgi:hypothetical protein
MAYLTRQEIGIHFAVLGADSSSFLEKEREREDKERVLSFCWHHIIVVGIYD